MFKEITRPAEEEWELITMLWERTGSFSFSTSSSCYHGNSQSSNNSFSAVRANVKGYGIYSNSFGGAICMLCEEEVPLTVHRRWLLLR